MGDWVDGVLSVTKNEDVVVLYGITQRKSVVIIFQKGADLELLLI